VLVVQRRRHILPCAPRFTVIAGDTAAEGSSKKRARAYADSATACEKATIDSQIAQVAGTMLPARYRLRCTGDFARKFFVCLVTVIWKLGQREAFRPSCVAEELAAHILIREAEALLEGNGVHPDFADFREAFFGDLDFEYLYDDASDGIEASEIAEGMGITNLAFGEWFERFGPPETSSYTEVHPYAQDNGDSDVEASSS